MNESEYLILYQKMLEGKCTPEEKERLLNYKHKLNIQDFNNDDRIENQERIKQEIYTKLFGQIESQRLLHRRLWRPIAAAASVVLILGIGLYVYLQPPENTGVRLANHVEKGNQISAGGDKAILTLSNGKEVNLGESGKGIIYHAEGIRVTKSEKGQIVYAVTGSNNTSPEWNIIKTPVGGKFQIILPDGTRVWLNAASTLKFPASFQGKQRNVEVNGEAYFEVAKNKQMPFIVNAHGLKVNVLGTHFNVSAYEDEQQVKTTLLEGSVQLAYGSQSKMLIPGEQGSVIKGTDMISKAQVNTEEVISWKNGYFIFRKENIKTIMAKVARWYGVEVEYQGNMENIALGGTVSRDEEISELLGKLEFTGAVHFKIEGRKVRVISN